MTSPIDQIRRYHAELTAIRHDIHAHPELGLEEHRTADLVARKLEEWGIEVHRGVGGTGVVGVLRSGNGEATIGLRADMDALPIVEANDLPYRSQNQGKMHACGHDGHTTMLLGAARYLAETRNFNGTVNFIFQPGEEGVGGALAMLQDDLFERFPCNAVYGMHNRPGMPVGKYGIAPGTAMAGGGFFDIAITGKGAHGARPEELIDPVLVACHIGAALQSIVARNVSPRDTAVLSVTRILSGDAYNVIPQTATLGGTVRTMKRETMTLVEQGMQRIVERRGVGVRRDGGGGFPPDLRAAGQSRSRVSCDRRCGGGAGGRRQRQPRSRRRRRRPRISPSCWSRCRAPTSISATATARRCTTITTTSTTRRYRSDRRCFRGWSNGSCRAAPNNRRRHPC